LDTYEYTNELWFFSMDSDESASLRVKSKMATMLSSTGPSDYDDMNIQDKADVVGHWTLAPTGTGPMPSKRDHTTISYDKEHHALLVFGGRTSEEMVPAHNDLWQYSLVTQTWTLLTPTGRIPETRYLHMASMIKGAMVLFGGEHITKYALGSDGSKDHKLNDLWAYAIKANRWVQLTQSDCKVMELLPPKERRNDSTLIAWMLLVGVGLGVGLILLSHKCSPGGGVDPFDYCRPRLRTTSSHGQGSREKRPLAVDLGPTNDTNAKLGFAGARRVNYQSVSPGL